MDSALMDIAALGRPFTLGMLYDARKDKLIPGLNLWDAETPQMEIRESSQRSSKFDICASDSTESKSSLLDVEASLKASFLSGLIEVEGSAKYLNDQRKFKNQSKVTCQYKATTHFKQLKSIIDFGTLDPQQIAVMEKASATHVVTAILYGANAFFVFDSEKLEANSVESIQGSMEAVIKKIPSLNIEGKVGIKLSDEEKAVTDKFSCKFYGDFILQSNPVTFEDAVKTYMQLPQLLGKDGENAVPLKVWMMSLKNLHSKAADVPRGISVGLVRKVQEALEDLRDQEIGCNDLLDESVVKHFPQIHEKLSSFQTLCVHFRAALEQTIANKLPFIRAGEEDENNLEKALEERDKSPFSQETLTKWMDDKEKEINIVRSLVEMMAETKIASDQSELDREVLSPGVDDALCFVFTSLGTADPRLDAMTNYLDSVKLGSTDEDQWYSSNEVITTMRDKAKALRDLAKALKNSRGFRFLVAAVANEKYKGASIYRYKNGVLVTDNFSKPDITDVENVTDRNDLIWYACDLTLDLQTANSALTLSEGNKKVARGAWRAYHYLPQRFKLLGQVLCKEELTGRRYWEVEWSAGCSEDVAVGVTYKGLLRKGKGERCRLGWNVMSWCLGRRWTPPDPTFYAEHNKQCRYIPFPASGCTRLGVYLDWAAGSLSFYKVSSDTLSHIHTFHSRFSEPVYPAFLIWRENNHVQLSL